MRIVSFLTIRVSPILFLTFSSQIVAIPVPLTLPSTFSFAPNPSTPSTSNTSTDTTTTIPTDATNANANTNTNPAPPPAPPVNPSMDSSTNPSTTAPAPAAGTTNPPADPNAAAYPPADPNSGMSSTTNMLLTGLTVLTLFGKPIKNMYKKWTGGGQTAESTTGATVSEPELPARFFKKNDLRVHGTQVTSQAHFNDLFTQALKKHGGDVSKVKIHFNGRPEDPNKWAGMAKSLGYQGTKAIDSGAGTTSGGGKINLSKASEGVRRGEVGLAA